MSEVQRFKAALPSGNWPDNPEDLVRCKEGAFVLFTDYERLRQERDKWEALHEEKGRLLAQALEQRAEHLLKGVRLQETVGQLRAELAELGGGG